MQPRLLFIPFVFLVACSLNDAGADENKAFIMAKDFVKAELKAPSTADFESDYKYKKENDSTYSVILEVDSENSFGAKLRSKWLVTLSYRGGDWTDQNNWTLQEITMY
jgi:hypothetical protein